MSPEMEALRSHQGVVASVIAAAIGFTLFCLVGIAVLLGWIGPGVRPLTTKAPAAAHAPANELPLPPGETVVATPGPPAPASPPPPAPAPATPVPAPATPVTPAPATKPAAPPPVQRKPVNTMAPRARPEFARAPASTPVVVPATKPAPAPTSAPHPSDPGDPW